MTNTLSSNPYEPIFTAQKALFEPGQRAREWRLDQLARMERMVSENEAELQDAVKSDFKTASREYFFETLAAIGEVAFQRSQLACSPPWRLTTQRSPRPATRPTWVLACPPASASRSLDCDR